ncbi:hypothetical protein [Streptomyces sp. 5-6(2022)]|uniref:hypothetical protein n=1 Tax=Streptomyces sp. 5-6(2022) TaxID=2936510 RepID=UPI0023B9FD5A|nr:hypothetical protein [Streptomyces sp. 5-6(2022)]
MRAWAQEWLERRVIGESTRRNYEGFIRNHRVPRLGRKMLAGLARRDFEEFAKDVHASGAGLAVRTVFVPLKHRAEGEYRDVPVAPFVEQEIDDHLSQWEPVSVTFTGLHARQSAALLRLDRFGKRRTNPRGLALARP